MNTSCVELRWRAATAADSNLLADLVIGVPEQEITRVAMRLYGITQLDHARDLFRIMWRADENWRHSALAELDGEPVGVLQTGHSSMAVNPGLVVAAAKMLPILVMLRIPGRLRMRGRVMPHMPHHAYAISELHVAADRRRQGLGLRMLEHAEADARRLGFREMALVTLTTNPARRLYERFGFVATQTRTDPEFARITGADGNLLMQKSLL